MKRDYDFGRLGINEVNRSEYIAMLEFKQQYFVPAKFAEMDKVSITIDYDLVGLCSFDELKETTEIFRMQAIRSLIGLVEGTNPLMQVDLSSENLYFGQNSQAFQLLRVIDSKRDEEESYAIQIKALLGNLIIGDSLDSILADKGQTLEKSTELMPFAEMMTLQEIKQQIDILIAHKMKKEVEDKVSVDKKFVGRIKMISKIKSVIILLILVLTIYLTVIFIPNRTSQLTALESYQAGIYEQVITEMKGTNISSMSPVMKYIMAESTIRISQLSDTQKDNILYNLSPTIEENILDFWILIGQGNLEQAYDQSIKNNDAQQKAYVLLLLIDQTQNDTSLKTEEKEALISTYQGELDAIKSSMEEDKEIE